jgi:hypothetical protein
MAGSTWVNNLTAAGSIAGALDASIDANAIAVFSVVYYGADPTGAVDSSGYINSAIAAASAAGGGMVYFPPGKYLVSYDVNPASNLVLYGPCATLKAGSNTLGASILSSASALSNLVIYGLTLDISVDLHSGSPVTAIAFTGMGSTDITFERMRVQNGGGSAGGSIVRIGSVKTGTDFTSGHCERIRAINCDFVNVDANTYEILEYASCDDSLFDGCTFSNCSGNASLGVYGYNNGIVVSNCIFADNPAGEILVVAGQNISIEGCIIKNSTPVMNTSSQLINVRDVNILGNIFNGNSGTDCWWQYDFSTTWESGTYDVQFENSQNVQFADNSFASYAHGIVIAEATGPGYNDSPTGFVLKSNAFSSVSTPITYTNAASASYSTFDFSENTEYNPTGFQSSSTLTSTVTNPYPFPCEAVVSGGLGVTSITLTSNGSSHSVALGSGTFLVPVGGQVSASYTTAPTIYWYGL